MGLEGKVKNAFLKISKVVIPLTFVGALVGFCLNNYTPSEEALQMKREYMEEQKVLAHLKKTNPELYWNRPRKTPEIIAKLNKNIEISKKELEKVTDMYTSFYILGGLMGALSLLSAYSSYKHIKKRQGMQLNTPLNENPPTLLDKIAEYPSIPSLFAGVVGVVAIHMQTKYNLEYFPKNLKLTYYVSQLFFTGLGFGTTYAILSRAKLLKRPNFQNYLKSFPLAFKIVFSKENKTKQANMERQLTLVKYRDNNYFASSFALNLLKKDFLASLDDCKVMIEHKKDFFNDSMLPDFFHTISSTPINKLEEYFKKRRCKLNPNNPFFKISLQFKYLIEGNYKKAKSFQKEICNLETHKKELNFLESLVLDSIDEPALAAEQWERSIDLVMSDPNLQDYLESIEGHKVYRLVFNEFLKSVITIKEDDLPVLKSELDNLNYLASKITNDEFEVISPIKILNLKDRNFLIEKHATGKSLIDSFNNSHDYGLFRKTATFLALIHAKMPTKQVNIDYKADLERKLRESSLPEHIKKELFENIDCFIKPFYNNPLVFDRDAHIEQWFVAEDKIIAIDLPSRGYIPAEFDTSKLFNRGNFFSRDSNGSNLKDEILITDYLHTYNSTSENKREEQEFLLSSLHATPIKALTYYLFALRNPVKMPPALDFINNAMDDISRILNKPGEISLPSAKQYQNFSNTLRTLKSYNVNA